MTKRLTTGQVRAICELLQDGELTAKEIAERIGTTQTTVRLICARKSHYIITKDYDFSNANVNHRTPTLPKWKVEKIKSMLLAKIPEIQIIVRLGVSRKSIIKIAKKYNIERTAISHSAKKLDDETVRDICKDLADNEFTMADIAKKYNTTSERLRDILNGKTFVHISKDFDFSKRNKRRTNRNRRLSRGDVIAIFDDLQYTDESCIALADKYGVSSTTIYSILNRESHIDISKNYSFSKRIK